MLAVRWYCATACPTATWISLRRGIPVDHVTIYGGVSVTR